MLANRVPMLVHRLRLMVMALRSKWAVGKAVRAGLAVGGRIPHQFCDCAASVFRGSCQKLVRDVTDEQRGRRPIFNATLRAAAGWLFFRVARSTRMTQIWALYRQSSSDRLEKQPTDLRRHHHHMRDGALGGVFLLGVIVVFSRHGGSEWRRPPNRISENGTVLWQGKPFFPVGIYHVRHTAEEYRTLAENGFNMIQGPFATDVETFLKRLDLALSYGLAVDVPLYAGGKVKENLANSLRLITAAAAHPAVLCWKILDEPDADHNVRVRREVPDAYLALKAARPMQPIELTLSQDASLQYWANHCDIVQIDRYPVPSKPLTEVFDFCRNAKASMAPWQSLIFVVQCGWTPDLKTQPTFAQAHAMVYLALIGGAKGIAWYSRQENGPDGKPEWDLMASPLWRRLKEINFELHSLASPVLLGENVDGIKCGASGIYAAAKRWQDKLYLLVCNPKDRPVEAAFKLPPGIRLRSASAIGLSAEPVLDGSNVHVSFSSIDSGTIVCEIGQPSA